MTGAARRPRVVMTFDSAEVDAGDLARLSNLARRLGAEFEAVFVQDDDVLQLAQLPFLREFRFASMRLERLDPHMLETELSALARRAEHTLATQAVLREIPWHFRIWRGSLEQELVAAMKADVLALHKPRLPVAGAVQGHKGTVAVCYEGGESGRRALSTGCALAQAVNVPLVVLLAGDPERFRLLRREAEATMAGLPPEARFVALPEITASVLAAALRSAASGALVVARTSALLRTASLRNLMESLGCRLLLVGEGEL